MSTRRSNTRDSFVGSQILERRRMLSAAIDGRELAGLFGTGRAIEESIVARQSNSSSSSTKTDSRIGQIKTSIPEIAGSDSSRVITPRGSSHGSGTTMSKGPEGGSVLFMSGTGGDDHFVISANGTQIVVELNGIPFIFDDTIYNSIDIDGLGGADTINVESNGANPTTLRGGAGEDLITLTSTGGDLDFIASPVLVDGGVDGALLEIYDDLNTFGDPYLMTSSAVAREFFGGVNFGSLTGLVFYCQNADSTLYVESTPACPVTVFGGGGNDLCNITPSSGNLENLSGTFRFDGEEGTDTINLFDGNNTFDDAWTMDGTDIARPFVDPITCQAESIGVAMGSGNNPFTLNNFAQQLIGVNGGPGNDSMTVNALAAGATASFAGHNGTDAMAVESTAAGSLVEFFGEGDDDAMSIAYSAGDLAAVAGAVNFDGSGGSNQATLWDDLNDGGNSYLIDSSQVTRGGFGGLTWSNASKVTLNAQRGDNEINVDRVAVGTEIEIFGNDGNDNLRTGFGFGNLSLVLSPVKFDGGAGNDSVNFFDDVRSTSVNYSLSDSTLSGSDFPVQTFLQVESVQLEASSGVNTIDVMNTSSLVQTVYGNGGADIFNIPISLTPVRINGGIGLDQFNIGLALPLQAGDTAQAIAVSLGAADLLGQLAIASGSSLRIADQHTLASPDESIFGTLSFGQRSSYIAVANANPMPLIGALSYIANGYATGAWTGSVSSFSSHYSATSTAGDGIGYARASDIGVSIFQGVGVFANDVIFTQTRYGDANLDHTVNFADLLRLAQNYNGTSKHWFQGDFDYN
ncbi:MAG TPA: hypothetical protein PK402_02505, partial [Tepidisphaeraceae bacterium]|nr:hypothetical protein [Tepidisphaeraceae bacterium]